MYKRILFYVDATQTRLEELKGLLDLAEQLRCRLIALAVLAPQTRDASKERRERRDALEDRIWNFLYQIEDVAFEREIKISLMLEEDAIETAIVSVVKSYEIDLCATFPYKSIDVERLAQRLGAVPLLLFNQEGR